MPLKNGQARDGMRNDSVGADKSGFLLTINDTYAIPSSEVLRYEFESGSGSTVADSWGSNNGTTNATWNSSNAIKGSYSLEHDGTDETVSDSTLPSSVTGASSRTLGCWVRPLTIPSSSFNNLINYGNTGTSNEAFGFMMDDPDGNLEVFVWGNDFNVGTALNADTTYHLVATYDGSDLRTYVDGSETSNSPTSISLNTGSSALYCGARMDSQNYSNVILDEVRIYDKALTDTEVNDWYNTGGI